MTPKEVNQRKKTFKDGDTREFKPLQKELRVQVMVVKEQYRRKIQQRMQNNNMRAVCQWMKTITGCNCKRGASVEGWWKRKNS